MKRIILTLLFLIAARFAFAQSIEHVYHYRQPLVSQNSEYQILSFEDCLNTGTPGEPMLPWQSVSLMLPQNTEATAIHVTLSDFTELEGQYNLMPAQRPRPISDDSPITFEKNNNIYSSTEAYPYKTFDHINTQILNGVSFAFGGFTPIKYIPALGKVSYAQTVTVTIDYQSSRENHSRKLWLRPETRNSINRLAQNAELLDSYSRRDGQLPTYDILIITSQTYSDRFDDYIALYAGQGLRARVATKQAIFSAMQGRDNPEKIRNYIIQEYENNGIQMVMLGGDVDVVPSRSLWCHAQEGYDDYVPSDSYFACLDGTLNDDGDNKWGEIGEDDILPELAVSRLPFTNAAGLETIFNKTFSYLTNPVLGEFRKPILAGEHLGDGYYASSDLERLVGSTNYNGYMTHCYEESYDFVRVYASENHEWDVNELRNAICDGAQYVNHFGHANTNFVAGWSNWDITPELFAEANGVDHNYVVFKSQGCICGDFADDCILERMVLNETGVFAAIGNSRYGWYSQAGDGPSNHYHRELIDAHCHERIAGLGQALKECKIQTSPFIVMDGENGTIRWSFYALNLLGDVAARTWFDEPFTPNIDCETTLPVGTNRLPVIVTDEDGNAQFNYECRLFKGDELIGLALTNENGEAEIRFDAVNNTDSLDLYVVGMNGWPQHITLVFDNQNCAHVLFDSYSLNDPDGQVDFNESQTLNVNFRNVGNLDANNVSAVLLCDNPYITITQDEATVGTVNSTETVNIGNAFSFTVSDDVPDQSMVSFTLICSDGNETWNSIFDIPINAPDYCPITTVLEEMEGNNNGHADYGETITLHFFGKNIGHSLSPNTVFGVFCSAPEIIFNQHFFNLGDIAPDGTYTVDFTLSIAEGSRSALAYELILATYSGSYIFYDSYLLNVDCLYEDFETGNFSSFDWQFEGEGGWQVVSYGAYEGQYCIQSTPMGHNRQAIMSLEYDFIMSNEVSFMLRTSTETCYDFLVFYVDDERYGRWSGETGWTEARFTIPEGNHTLTWSYEKDGGAVGGEDCVWLDYIVFPPTDVVLDMNENATGSETILYPNPTYGDITMELHQASQISIYNLMGQNVINMDAVSGLQKLHLNEAGVYFVHISNVNGVEVKKVVVE